jgi:FKBP-type peptidyl-prolyl cis-trans isomerase SlyD
MPFSWCRFLKPDIEKFMIAEKNKVVTFHYTLTNADGEEMESSHDKDPMTYLHGANNIILGLEKAMEGHAIQDKFTAKLEPEDAYGIRNENNVQRVPLKRIKGIGKVSVGQILKLQTKQGPVQVTVLKVGRFNVDVDANHPLAGIQLTFDVEITDIRDASDEETKHGHAHGPGGHQH